MSRINAGETVTLTTTVTDKDTGLLADAPDLTFRYMEGGMYGEEKTLTPTHVSTGIYSVSITTTLSGNLYYRWDTDGDFDVASEGVINIAETVFEI